MYRPFRPARKGRARENCRSLRGEDDHLQEVVQWDFPYVGR
jgi:hypothetical protein